MFRNLFTSCLLFLLLSVVSCTKVDIRFGDQYLDNGNTQIVMSDTFEVSLSNIQVDSFAASGSGIAFVGGYNDPEFGKIRSSTYLELALPSYSDIYREASYDSVELIITPNQYYYGDTSIPLNISVHQLAEAITAYNESAVIYNTQKFSVLTNVLGQTAAMVRPLRADTISIRLSDQFGNALFGKLQDPADPEINTVDGFLQYMKGLRISTSSTHLMAGFKDSVKMRVHYSKPGLYKQELFTDFVLNNTSHQFNAISTDRTGTPLQLLNSLNNEILSTQTNHQSYVQYLSGVMTKIRFPTIREILKVPNFVKILQAKLILRPVHGTYQGYFTLPPALSLAQTNALNQIGADITIRNSSGEAVSQTGDLQIDYLYGQSTQYTYDVTEYIQTVLETATINRDGLLALPPSPSFINAFNRVILGDRQHGQNKIELQLYYATVK